MDYDTAWHKSQQSLYDYQNADTVNIHTWPHFEVLRMVPNNQSRWRQNTKATFNRDVTISQLMGYRSLVGELRELCGIDAWHLPLVERTTYLGIPIIGYYYCNQIDYISKKHRGKHQVIEIPHQCANLFWFYVTSARWMGVDRNRPRVILWFN